MAERTGQGFDPRYRACSLADAARSLKMTIAKVRSLEETALAKFRRQMRADKIADWAEAVHQAAAERPTANYQYRGRWRIEFEPLFMLEWDDPPPGVPRFTKLAFRRAGARSVRRFVGSARKD